MEIRWIRRLLLAAAVACGVSGCQSPALTSARIYIQQEDWERAAAQLETVVAQTPDDGQAWELLGVARAHLGQAAESGAAFDRAVAADASRRDETETWRTRFRALAMNRGAAALEAQDFAAAATAFQEAAGLDPRSADAQRSLGYVNYQLNRVDDAIAAYQRALELDPGHEDTVLRLGYLYYNEGRYQEAVEHLGPVAEDSADAQLLTVLANAYLALDRDDDALEALRRAQAAAPGNVDLLMETGRLLWDRDDFAGAAEAYAAAVEADSGNADPRHNLAMAQLELARIAETRGDSSAAATHAAAARSQLERVVELAPDAGDAWYWLGVLYAKGNRVAESEAAFRKAAALGVE